VKSRRVDFLFVGVGGQGIVLASDVVAALGLAIGYDVKKSEIHGMSQRGGSVESFVRWGDTVASPVAERGRVDLLVGFELLEAARWANFLRPGGVAILNRQRIPPLSVAGGQAVYPSEDAVAELYRSRTDCAHLVDGLGIAQGLGSPNIVSVVLLGVLSRELDVPAEAWLDVVRVRVPLRFRELNERAFWAGRQQS
jgi:indolepyruvate ferredoxin oxidoreductase beta subunit